MDSVQLNKIKNFSKKYYTKTGKYHAWDHILLTKKYALSISKEIKNVDKKIIEASCYLHDIGRSIKDEGHPIQSAKIFKPFLNKIGISSSDTEKIVDTVISHDIEAINNSKFIEARILFDADKLQILSVFGFIRCVAWLSEERNMKLIDAINFLWKYCRRTRDNYLYTQTAKKQAKKEMLQIWKIVKSCRSWTSK